MTSFPSENGENALRIDGDIPGPQPCDDCREPSMVLVECARCSMSLCLSCSASHAVQHGATEGAPEAGYLNPSALPCWAQWLTKLQPDLLVAPNVVAATLPWFHPLQPAQVIRLAATSSQPKFDKAVLLAANIGDLAAVVGAMQLLASSVFVISRCSLPCFTTLEVFQEWQLQEWQPEVEVPLQK